MSDTNGWTSVHISHVIYLKSYLQVDLKPWLEKCSNDNNNKKVKTVSPWAAEFM